MGKLKINVPARDRDIYNELSARFRAGDIFSFSFDGRGWLVFTTEADYNAMERNGRIARPDLAVGGRAPVERDSDAMRVLLGLGVATRPAKLSKLQLVKGLNALRDKLPPEAVALLEAA